MQGPSRTRGLLLRPWSLHLMEVGGGEEGGQVILGPLIPTPSPSTPCCSEQRGAMSTWSTQSAELRLGGNSRLRSILPSPSEDGHGMERGPGLILPRPEPTRSRLCVPSPLPRAHLLHSCTVFSTQFPAPHQLCLPQPRGKVLTGTTGPAGLDLSPTTSALVLSSAPCAPDFPGLRVSTARVLLTGSVLPVCFIQHQACPPCQC